MPTSITKTVLQRLKQIHIQETFQQNVKHFFEHRYKTNKLFCVCLVFAAQIVLLLVILV